MPYRWMWIVLGAGVVYSTALRAGGWDGEATTSSQPSLKSENGVTKTVPSLPMNQSDDEDIITNAREIERRHQSAEHHLKETLRSLQGIRIGESDLLLGDAKYDNSAARTGFGYSLRERTNRLSYAEEEVIGAAGTLRAQGCTQLLLNRIAVKGNVPILTRIPRVRYHDGPALDALYRIGEPACRAALNRIPLEPDSDSRALMVSLLRTCLDDAKARQWLIELQARTPEDADQRLRISEAIDQIDSNRSVSSYLTPSTAEADQETPRGDGS